MTVNKETIKILDDLMYKFQCSVDDGLNSNDKDAIEALVSNQEVVMVLNIAKRHIVAWNDVLEDIQRLRNCSCSTSDGIIDDIEDIINKHLGEVNI